MRKFTIVLCYELKEYFTNRLFMGLTVLLAVLGAALLCLPRFVDMSGFTGVKVVGEGEDASDADQEEQELFLYLDQAGVVKPEVLARRANGRKRRMRRS